MAVLVLVEDVVGVAYAFFWPDCRGARSSFAVDDDVERLVAGEKKRADNDYHCNNIVH